MPIGMYLVKAENNLNSSALVLVIKTEETRM